MLRWRMMVYYCADDALFQLTRWILRSVEGAQDNAASVPESPISASSNASKKNTIRSIKAKHLDATASKQKKNKKNTLVSRSASPRRLTARQQVRKAIIHWFALTLLVRRTYKMKLVMELSLKESAKQVSTVSKSASAETIEKENPKDTEATVVCVAILDWSLLPLNNVALEDEVRYQYQARYYK